MRKIRYDTEFFACESDEDGWIIAHFVNVTSNNEIMRFPAMHMDEYDKHTNF